MSSRIATLVFATIAASPAFAQDFQFGARAKGMGGNYVAIDDDPAMIWHNPAAIAGQKSQMAIHYQTYTLYEPDFSNGPSFQGHPEAGFIDPQVLPSFQGFIFQFGDNDHPMALGVAYLRPFHIKWTWEATPFNGVIDSIDEQEFSRLRLAYGYDFGKMSANDAGRIALGFALDIGFTKWNRQFNSDFAFSNDIINDDTATVIGFGFGFLGTFGDTKGKDFKATVGMNFNSNLDFKLQRSVLYHPIWEWPMSLDLGAAFFLGPDQRLRLTVDLIMISWSVAIAFPFTSEDFFRDTVNLSIGAEYMWPLDDKDDYRLYTRAGFKTIQMPWEDEDDLPGSGLRKVSIDTRSSSFTMITLGLGLGWKSDEGPRRSIDFGIEFGGDADTFSFGYVHEF